MDWVGSHLKEVFWVSITGAWLTLFGVLGLYESLFAAATRLWARLRPLSDD